MSVNIQKLAEEIIGGRRLVRGEDFSFFETCAVSELCEGADAIRKALSGEDFELCSIINGRSGKCSEDCKFCAQRAGNRSVCEEYFLLEDECIFAEARSNEKAGVHRFSIVTSGKKLCGDEFNRAVSLYERMSKELHIGLCASMGFLSKEQLRALKNAGVTRYHHNIETSKHHFSNICTTHTYDMKVQTITWAIEEGMEVCSGGIIGMGETFADRIDMALSLSELGVCSIPINVLRPIPGTPFENNALLQDDEIVRTIALFKYINPECIIRFGAGRNIFADKGVRAFSSGMSAAITGDMLTTAGISIANDKSILISMGRKV